MYIYKAGVVGAGLMGGGIAQVISYSGLPVVLKDVDEKYVQKGLAAARAVYEGRVKKGKMSAGELESKMALITGTTKWDDFSDVDVVIEAVPEEFELKKRVFAEMDAKCPEQTILCSNTSALSISALAAATKRPEKVIGMHFFFPAPVMKLVEVIPGLQTSTETTDTIVAFTESIRKLPVRVKECAGFLVNRLLMPYVNEAAFCLQEGAASAKEIDAAMVAFGMPMGPFTLTDNLGLDVCTHAGRVMWEAYGPRMAPADILVKLFEAKRLGTKTGGGFYTYNDQSDPLPAMIGEIQTNTGRRGTKFSVERLLYPMVNEAATCLEENVCTATEVDLAMMAGTGFPMPTGGLLQWADTQGLDAIVAALEVWSRDYGPRFWPAPLLRRMAGAGMTGTKAKRGFHAHE
ncbi:MAG: 3-hydroxyacyl-CoA dehydrogenase [Planctomycetes bacterium]|nr:3-hydroxyacyl-CoA dehydrogenase [Planctomycetota bacterium]